MAPPNVTDTSNWVCDADFVADKCQVRKYTSSKTGLRMVHADVEGPLVQGFIVLSTETKPLDGDGLPHTLEHLVFMGSEDYPYKGVLDSLANRCFADGTNAWTGTAQKTQKTRGS